MLNTCRKILKNQQLITTQAKYKHEGYKLSYVSSTSKTPLLSDTVGKRVELAAELYGDKEAFIFSQSGKRLTFKTLKQKAEDFAAGLISIGLRKGDRVGIWAPNCAEWIITQYATALAGIIQVNINPAYKTSELEYSLNKVGCKALILSEQYKTSNYVNMLMEVCPEIQSSQPGQIKSKRLPEFKSAIVISEKKQK